MATVASLMLVCESKICDLVPCDQPAGRWEASGVLVKDRQYFVVFDDRTEIARVADDLQPSNANGLFGPAHPDSGYEGITYNHATERFYLLVESRKHAKGCYRALIVEYDDEFQYLKERPVDFTFKSNNKGFEAVSHVRRDDKDYLLALCRATSADVVTKVGSRAAGGCRCSRSDESAGGMHVPSRCRPRFRFLIIRACRSTTVGSRSSRR